MNLKVSSLLAITCVQLSWSSLVIIMKDGQGKAIQGVTCSQYGNTASATTDVAGSLTLNGIISSIHNQPQSPIKYSLSQIPLAMGEKANLKVMDISGKVVLNRQVFLGDRVAFSEKNKGIYFVNISSQNYSTQGRFANTGKGLIFESIEAKSKSHLAKASAANAAANTASIICSKTGYATQGYQLVDGSTNTIDFTKLTLVALYDQSTALQPAITVETDTAIITHWADRARDRHSREDEFHNHAHYLAHYWDHRTIQVEIIDYVAKGGKKVVVHFTSQWPIHKNQEEFRTFYRGIGTVAEYVYDIRANPDGDAQHLKYTKSLDQFWYVNVATGQALHRDWKMGDKMEMEISQFLEPTLDNGEVLVGRANYYGSVVLYVVGKGIVPWETHGVFGDKATDREDSYPIPDEGWSGGDVTLPYQYSNEPQFHFIQMAGNLNSVNGQTFVKGRRVHHTNFVTGVHDEPDNPIFTEMVGKAGLNYVNTACTACHLNNGRAIPPATTGSALSQYVVKVGDGNGNAHPQLGSVLQPKSTGATPEASVTINGWTETDGLRKPTYAFSGGPVPTQFSARIAPQLVGMGLLEAIPESAIQAIADPDDANNDGISGKMQIVSDYVTGAPHLGRFGWKAGKQDVTHQVAGAFNTDMGVMTSIYPDPDCGSAQTNCGNKGSEIADSNFQNLVDYVSLLGVPARRDLKDPVALQGEALFTSVGCTACHSTTFTTSVYHPKSELRNQKIHPYTDLLLHDMGLGLADNLPEGGATGAEWRTPPLWGIGLTASVSGGEGYLHDGRARTLTEAILWHGGEGVAAQAKFKALSANDQAALIKFLKSL